MACYIYKGGEYTEEEVKALIKEDLEKQQSIKYTLSAVKILQSDKAKQVFEKGKKNNWDLNKILTELQIPKEQKQLVLDLNKTNREDVITDLLTNYSYIVEINTAKSNIKTVDYVGDDLPMGIGFVDEIETKELNNTNYYSNLTVAGGTNYTENEITTPDITPNIKGHAQFATNNGIGWFRSDEREKVNTENEYASFYINGARYLKRLEKNPFEEDTFNYRKITDTDSKEITITEYNKAKNEALNTQGIPTKTRRILEVQSDLFQKGRDKTQLDKTDEGFNIDNIGNKFEQFTIDGVKYVGLNGHYSLEDSNDPFENVEKTITKEEFLNKFKEYRKLNPVDTTKNQFLQLLNKDNNWVTFFVKSIIQDSVKKGYEKVLFPSGNTASKVEGHTTIEEFELEKRSRLNHLQTLKEGDKFTDKNGFVFSKVNGEYFRKQGYSSSADKISKERYLKSFDEYTENIDVEINQLKQELERVETEGFGALKPIYNFYENTITNILNKTYGKENVKVITDEYSNTWNEINLNNLIKKYSDNYTNIDKVTDELGIILYDINDDSNIEDTYNTESNLNYGTLLKSKERSLNIIKDKIRENTNKRKKDKSEVLKREYVTFVAIEEELKTQIEELKNSSNKFEKTFFFLNNDINMIEQLLSDEDNIENMYLAEDLLEYLIDVVENKPNNLLNVNKDTTSEIILEIQKLRNKVVDVLQKKLERNKRKHLLKIVDNSPKLKSIYPEKQEEKLLTELLKSRKDISKVEKHLFIDTDLKTEGDSAIKDLIVEELYREDSKLQKSVSSNIEAINNARIAADKIIVNELKEGIGALGKRAGYDSFYQKDSFGNKTPFLITKFSHNWYTKELREYNNNYSKQLKEFYKAMSSGNWDTYNEELVRKHAWLNDRANMLDLSKLSDLASNEEFKILGDFFAVDELYKQNVIKEIGEKEYKKLITQQENKLHDFINKYKDDLSSERAIAGNPFYYINSLKDGKQGVIEYSKYHALSNANYNTFYPKLKIVKSGVETNSNFYDKNFSKIENNKDLRLLWENLYDGLIKINEALTDSNSSPIDTSIVAQQRVMMDILLDKGLKGTERGILLTNELRDNIKDIFSQDIKLTDIGDKIAKSGISDINTLVKKQYEIEKISIKNILGVDNIIVTDVKKVPSTLKNYLIQLTNSKDEKELENKIGKSFNLKDVVISYIGNNIVDEQHFDLPTSINNYLRMSALYKARKRIYPKVKLLQEYYNNLKNEQGSIRSNANERMSNWIKRNVQGADVQGDEVGAKIGDAYKENEKILKERLEEELVKAAGNEALINNIKSKLENLGKTYTLAAGFDAIFIKLGYITSLGFNYMAAIPNRVAGMASGILRDGIDWTEGNFYIANAFTSRTYLKVLSTKQKEQIKISNLLIDSLNVVQDNTNEFDRAKSNSFVSKALKWFAPLYHVQLVEKFSQHPQVLAKLMDVKILDKKGNQSFIFEKDHTFPAFTTNEFGNLRLKEEYRTEKNIQDWEVGDTEEMTSLIVNLKDILIKANGDYAKFGNLYASKYVLGRAMAMFKKWYISQMDLRWSFNKNQPGKGIYIKALKEKKTRIATGAAIGTLASSSLLLGPIGIALAVGGMGVATGLKFYNKKTGKYNLEELSYIAQLADGASSILRKMYGIPLNVISGKHLVDTQSEINIDKDAKDNYEFIMKELAMAMNFLILKVLWNALNPDDGDDEEDKSGYFLLENELTEMLSTINVYTSYESLLQQSSPARLFSKLDYIPKMYNAYKEQNEKGDIQSGYYQGQNRMWVTTRKQFLPILFHNYGLGSKIEKDYTVDNINRFYKKDIVKDENRIKAERKLLKSQLKQEYLKKYPEKIAERLAQREVDKKIRKFDKRLYDKEGNKR